MANPDLADVSVSVIDGQLGARFGTGKLQVVAGCCEKGPTTLAQWSDPAALKTTHGYGPATEYAAAYILRTGKPVLFRRMASATPGVLSSVDEDLFTGTSAVTATGTPLDDYEIHLSIVTGGTRGTTGIVFRYSLDGGRNWSAKLALGVAVSYAIPNTGVTLAFASGTMVAGDLAIVYATGPLWDDGELDDVFNDLAASSQLWRSFHLVGPAAKTDLDALKTELDAYETVERRPVFAFASARKPHRPASMVGAPDLTFDAGDKTIVRDAGDFEDDGFVAGMAIDVDGSALNDGSYTIATVAGDTITVSSTDVLADEVGVADVAVTGEETKTIYKTALRASYDAFESARVSCAAGACRTSSVLHAQGWKFRREVGWAAAIRFGQRSISESLGRVKNGGLTDVAILDANSNLEEWDSRIDTGLSSLDGSNGRFVTLRTYNTRQGVYVAVPSMMHAPGSDFSRVHLRAVMDLACEVSYRVLEAELQDGLKLDATGHILESDARRIEKAARQQFEVELLQAKHASDAVLVLSRSDALATPATPLTGKVLVTPLGYVEGVEIEIAFFNPALAV